MSDRALEAFENAGLISRQYAASAIFDTDRGDIAGRGQGQQNGSSAAIFDRIGDEVVQDLLDREAVEKTASRSGASTSRVEPAYRAAGRSVSEVSRSCSARSKVLGMDGQFPGCHPRYLEQGCGPPNVMLHQFFEMLEAPCDFVVPRRSGDPAQALDMGQDRRHRVAKFVRRDCEETCRAPQQPRSDRRSAAQVRPAAWRHRRAS